MCARAFSLARGVLGQAQLSQRCAKVEEVLVGTASLAPTLPPPLSHSVEQYEKIQIPCERNAARQVRIVASSQETNVRYQSKPSRKAEWSKQNTVIIPA